uniref:Uncharacterized protein n=1 Tax=Graphocephala atropunctata TaxID=36148 RepID=A0A1B6KS60_9HEMI
MATTPQNPTPTVLNIRKLEKRRLKGEIEKTLSRFYMKQLTSDTIVNLFELDRVEINHHLNELKLPFKKQYVVQLLGIRTRAFSVEELRELHCLLQLYRIAYFSHTKMWTAVNLLEPDEDLQNPAANDVIKRNLLQAFRIKSLNAIVNVITHDDFVWVMIVCKKLTRNKGVKLQTPQFLCYQIGTPYLLVDSVIPATVQECILKAMKYKKWKIHQLEGRDIKSLLYLLRNRGINAAGNMVEDYEPAEAEVGHRTIDFTKRKARETYVNKVFQTTEPITLSHFTVSAETNWRDDAIVPEMAGEPFKATLKLKSNNIIEMIKDMVKNDMIVTPVPEYVQTILRSAKNKVVMRPQK